MRSWFVGVLGFGMLLGQAHAELVQRSRDLAGQASATGVSVVHGLDGWLFFVPELRHLGAGPFWGDHAAEVSRATRTDARDPLPVILDVHRQLQEHNVRLILMPVPGKAVIYPDRLPGDEPLSSETRADTHHQQFYDVLRAEGIEVLDLTDTFLEQRDHERGPMYCLQDTHWSGVACVLAAQSLAKMLNVERGDLAADAEWREVEIQGDLWQMLGDTDMARERIAVRAITSNGEPVPPSAESPVLVLGDSHGLVFQAGGDMHYRGAGLIDQLAYELGTPIDLVAVRGSGATPARINLFRRAQRDATFWDHKHTVIWVFSVREFTESDGWRIVPVGR